MSGKSEFSHFAHKSFKQFWWWSRDDEENPRFPCLHNLCSASLALCGFAKSVHFLSSFIFPLLESHNCRSTETILDKSWELAVRTERSSFPSPDHVKNTTNSRSRQPVPHFPPSTSPSVSTLLVVVPVGWSPLDPRQCCY